MIVLMNGEKMMYNVFKRNTRWQQIMDLSENPITLVDGQETLLPTIAPDKTLGIRIIKEPFVFKLLERMKNHLFQPQLIYQDNLL
jgi:L-threonylcarbamoyladenylate synthase